MRLKDEDDDIATVDEIEELNMLEENESNNIPIESESLIIGNTMNLDSPNFIVQPMALDSIVISEVVEDNIKENHDNREFE
ncbi:14890_t:CDS:1, partial [Racocetra persica]